MALSPQFKFRDNIKIGFMAAEEDESFLNDCFVNTTAFSEITNNEHRKAIILGRTGIGKSAILLRLKETSDNVIEIEPAALALNYISNSDILTVFSGLGVNLDIFYQLLWRHIFSVELLKHHFELRQESDFLRFKDWISLNLGLDSAKKAGLNYLQKWGTAFWAETEERVKEITQKLEREISAEIGIADATIKGIANSTEDIKREFIHKAQKVVDQIQIRDLGEVIRVISEDILNDQSKKYFILIDKLDENWVDDIHRYKLIRAMIEAIKTFRRIKCLKIVVALRTDLLERVYSATRDAGFQEEKYEDLNARVMWTQDELKDLVDKRINLSLKRIYTKGELYFRDVFPDRVGGKPTFDYLTQRTLMRPRDLIAFINCIFASANGKPKISEKTIRDAEVSYSEQRLRALSQEWQSDYPSLNLTFSLLEKRSSRFSIDEIKEEDLIKVAGKLIDVNDSNDFLFQLSEKLFDSSQPMQLVHFRDELLKVFYKVGAIGIKPTSFSTVQFSYLNSFTLSESQITKEASLHIHPMLWRSLGVYKQRLSGEVILEE